MHPEFEVHMLNAESKHIAQDIAEFFDELLSALEHICPPNREFSIARTKLEEACFFAKKSMAKIVEHQEVKE